MEQLCPLFKEPCLEHRCKWYIHVIGNDPQTGAAKDLWDCAMSWLPLLTIENTLHHRHTGAAVESLRNEMVLASKALTGAVKEAAKLKFNGEGKSENIIDT